jgi:HK97 gp10 family phage protein
MARLQSELPSYANEINSIVELVYKAAGTKMLEAIKQKVPVDTGDLRDSYTYKIDGQTHMTIGSNQFMGVYRRGHPTFYAPYVEFPTSRRRSAQPHFVPVWMQAERFITAEFKALFRNL